MANRPDLDYPTPLRSAPGTVWFQSGRDLIGYDVANKKVVDRSDEWSTILVERTTPAPLQFGSTGFFAERSPYTQSSCATASARMYSINVPPDGFGSGGDSSTEDQGTPSQSGSPEAAPYALGGSNVVGWYPQREMLFYDQVTSCSETDGRFPRLAVQYKALVVEDQRNSTSNVIRSVEDIVDGVAGSDGSLIVRLSPSGRLFRLPPIALTSTDRVLVEQGDELTGAQLAPGVSATSTRLVGADANGANYLESTSSGFFLRRYLFDDQATGNIVESTSEFAVADDGYGNLVVVADPSIQLVIDDKAPLTIVQPQPSVVAGGTGSGVTSALDVSNVRW